LTEWKNRDWKTLIVSILNRAKTVVARIELRYSAGDYQVGADAVDNGTSETTRFPYFSGG